MLKPITRAVAILVSGLPVYAHTSAIFSVPGAMYTYAQAINEAGAVTGRYADAQGISHGYIRFVTGAFVTFDAPGCAGTSPVAINDSGTVTGSCVDAVTSTTHGFARDSSGTVSVFDVPGGEAGPNGGSFPTAINKAGTIIGNYVVNNKKMRFRTSDRWNVCYFRRVSTDSARRLNLPEWNR